MLAFGFLSESHNEAILLKHFGAGTLCILSSYALQRIKQTADFAGWNGSTKCGTSMQK